MEVTGLCSTPKAEHKDYKIQPQGKNTSVTSRSISANQTCWLKPAALSHCFPPSPPLPSSTKTPEIRGSPLPGTRFVGHPICGAPFGEVLFAQSPTPCSSSGSLGTNKRTSESKLDSCLPEIWIGLSQEEGEAHRNAQNFLKTAADSSPASQCGGGGLGDEICCPVSMVCLSPQHIRCMGFVPN